MNEYYIGLDIGGTKVLGAIFDKDGKPVYRLKKKTKSGEKDTDISPFIKRCDFTCRDGGCEIICLLCADSSNYLNPEYIIRYLDKGASLDLENDPDSLVEICRKKVMIGNSEFR